MSNLLINDYPLMVSPKLAARIGLEEATFVQQIHWLCEKRINIRDGLSWVYNTYDQWLEMFPFFENEQRVGRIVRRLEKLGVLITTKKYNKLPLDKRKWYRVNYDSDVLDFSTSNLNDETSNLNDETSNLKEQYTQTSSIDFQHRLSSGCDPSCDFASETAPTADVDLIEEGQPESAVGADAEILPADKPKKPDPRSNPDNVKTWEAYARAYRARYGVLPMSNAKVRGQVAQFVKTVGAELAPVLAAYYPSHNKQYFVQRRHDFGALLHDYQQVATDYQIGQQMTGVQAAQAEKTQANRSSHDEALAILKAKGLA